MKIDINEEIIKTEEKIKNLESVPVTTRNANDQFAKDLKRLKSLLSAYKKMKDLNG
jgi:hypothetical protein